MTIDNENTKLFQQLRKTTEKKKVEYEQTYGKLSPEVRNVLASLYPGAWTDAAQREMGPVEGSIEYRDALVVAEAERERIITIVLNWAMKLPVVVDMDGYHVSYDLDIDDLRKVLTPGEREGETEYEVSIKSVVAP